MFHCVNGKKTSTPGLDGQKGSCESLKYFIPSSTVDTLVHTTVPTLNENLNNLPAAALGLSFNGYIIKTVACGLLSPSWWENLLFVSWY